nr:type II CAAX endopeptidase family protein [Ectobacillus ponti]
MQLSSIIGVPLLFKLGLIDRALPASQKLNVATGYWAIFSFFAALLVMLWLLRGDIRDRRLDRARSSVPATIAWIAGGVVLALMAQSIAANIEMRLFGIDPGSQNTEDLVQIARTIPAFILVTSILGPIMEEIVFRKILFGTLYQRYNFLVGAVLSSLIFAAVHFDFQHLLIYTSMGLVFAFLYVQTRRLIVPIMAHVLMNTFVILVNVLFSDEIQRMMREAEKLQSFIGGF